MLPEPRLAGTYLLEASVLKKISQHGTHKPPSMETGKIPINVYTDAIHSIKWLYIQK